MCVLNILEIFDDLRFTVEPQSTMAPPFTEVVLLCQAISDGRFTMRWMFNGASVMSKSGVTVDGGMLTIPTFRNHHQGSYHCVASNSFGAIRSKDANLTRAGPIFSQICDYGMNFFMSRVQGCRRAGL